MNVGNSISRTCNKSRSSKEESNYKETVESNQKKKEMEENKP